jgi:hypothetical protein
MGEKATRIHGLRDKGNFFVRDGNVIYSMRNKKLLKLLKSFHGHMRNNRVVAPVTTKLLAHLKPP